MSRFKGSAGSAPVCDSTHGNDVACAWERVKVWKGSGLPPPSGKRSGWAAPQTNGEKGWVWRQSPSDREIPQTLCQAPQHFPIDTPAKTPCAGPDPAVPRGRQGFIPALFPDFQEAAVPGGARRWRWRCRAPAAAAAAPPAAPPPSPPAPLRSAPAGPAHGRCPAPKNGKIPSICSPFC